MSEWRQVAFQDVLVDGAISYGIVQPGSHSEQDSVPIIRVNNIKNGCILTDDVLKVDKSIESKFLRTRLTGGELLITVVGSIGECAIVPERLKGWNVARAVSVARINQLADSRFIKYAFKSDDLIFQMYGGTNDTVQPTLNLSSLKSLQLTLPALPEQKAIANVLSSLDDKIDLLHRQNKILEAMAETLFRQWFVEEAGDDWNEIAFEDFFDFMEGPGIRNWQYTDSGTPFINIRLINNGEIDTSKASFVSNDEANGKYKHFHLQAGDMIVSTSGTLGKNAIVRDYHLPLLLNTSVIRFRPRDGKSYPYIYQYLQSRLFQEHLESTASGSVQANFGPTHLRKMTFQCPSKHDLDRYVNATVPTYEKLRCNQSQIRTLEKLRDTLLPKLMSGEVRVQYE